MAKTRALEIIYEISEILYQHGKYGMERIALICEIINDSMFSVNQNVKLSLEFLSDKFNFLVIDDIRRMKNCFSNLIKESYSDIANAIKQLIDNSLKNIEIIPTDDFSIKIMQTFAKKLNEGNAYIDPCIGTGRLLESLKADKYFGFDINLNATKIAKAYINLINNIFETKAYFDCLPENFLYRKFGLIHNISNPTYIFDPPLNNLIEMNPMLQEHLYQNGIYSNGNKIPSEYAFLAKILFGTNIDDCSFVCIFTNSFLFAQDKFKTSFRKYLFENSLVAVIQSNFSETSGVQKLILVGKSKLANSQNNLRYFITFKDKDVSEQNVSKVVEKCLNNEAFDEKEFYDIAKVKAYTIDEIRENDYQISMPQYFENEINPKDFKTLEEISRNINNTNKKLIEVSHKFELFISNLINGVKNIQNSANNPEIEKEIKPKIWFNEVHSDLNEALGIFSKEKELDWTRIDFKNDADFNIYLDSLSDCIMHLKELYNAKRLRYKNNYLEIYSKKELSDYEETKTLSEIIIEDNQKDEYIKTMFHNLSPKQIEIFNAFIRMHYDDDYVFDKFTTSELHSAIATLKILGLICVLPDIDDGFEKYFPYSSILDIKEID